MGFTVAIIGRPNVGKSTLFNRLAGRRLALVDDTPGVTRDRRIHPARLYDLRFDIIDTAGFEDAAPETLAGRMRQQTERAIDEADLIFFLVDAKAGVLPDDRTFADLVRRSGRPVVLVANKAEARAAEGGLLEAWELGLGDPVPVSAEHGQGLPELRDAVVEALGAERALDPDEEEDEPPLPAAEEPLIGEDVADPDAEDHPPYDPAKPLRIAVLGRPNAGKSTLINALIGEERLLTGPEAGITRDSISVDWQWNGRPVKLFDTAGMRRRAKVQEKLEKLSVADGLRAIRFAEVVVLIFDATIPFEKQDLQLADLAIREGRAPVIAFSKWDLIDHPQARLAELREMTERLLPQVRGIQAVPVSAETGRGLDRLMTSVVKTHEIWNRRVPTGRLNRWLEGILAHHPPPAVAGRRVSIKYMTQIKSRPPTFVLSTTRPDALGSSYTRYLVNGLREVFKLDGVPIRLILRKPDNPFAGKAKKYT
ncbi:MAG: ribosome biogenesis GTPase Der [Mesorhizobium sp.]